MDGKPGNVEKWVKAVAKKAGANMDWHYSGGIAQVLFLGDEEGRMRVKAAIQEFTPKLKGTIFRQFAKGADGLYRNGVTQPPAGAVASFFDGGSESTFIK